MKINEDDMDDEIIIKATPAPKAKGKTEGTENEDSTSEHEEEDDHTEEPPQGDVEPTEEGKAD